MEGDGRDEVRVSDDADCILSRVGEFPSRTYGVVILILVHPSRFIHSVWVGSFMSASPLLYQGKFLMLMEICTLRVSSRAH